MSTRHPFGWDLPPGCSQRNIDEAFGGLDEVECGECEGTGRIGSECCGYDVADDGLCPKCKEHASNAKCTKCDGEGFVQPPSKQETRNEAEEAKADAKREEDWL